MYVDEQAYLEHYGVKGMRWGVRKDDRSIGQRVNDYRAKKEKETTKRQTKIENINKRYDKKYGAQGKKSSFVNDNYRDARLLDKAKYSTGQRFAANMASYSLFALARRGGPANLARMGPYGRKLALMDTGVSAAASAFVTGYQNVRVNQILKKYNTDGTLKKR